MSKEWDVFISHAYEDKSDIAKPLAMALSDFGLKVWYDEFCFKPGDNIRRKIDEGLAKSNYGIVILSKVFMSKYWTNYELDGLVTIDSIEQSERIIPIWHEIDKKELSKYSPSLAIRYGLDTNMSHKELVTRIIDKINPSLLREILRRKVAYNTEQHGTKKYVDSRELHDSPRSKDTLPKELVLRLGLIFMNVGFYCDWDFDFWIDGFLRDYDPNHEAHIWEKITVLYMHSRTCGEFDTLEELKNLLAYCSGLFTYSDGKIDEYLDKIEDKYSKAIKKGLRIFGVFNDYFDKSYSDFERSAFDNLK